MWWVIKRKYPDGRKGWVTRKPTEEWAHREVASLLAEGDTSEYIVEQSESGEASPEEGF